MTYRGRETAKTMRMKAPLLFTNKPVTDWLSDCSDIHYLRNPDDFGGPLSPADLYRFAVDCRGFRISFCTRQLFISATNIMSSEGQASPCGQLNCFGPRPDSPSIPKIFPSSVSL